MKEYIVSDPSDEQEHIYKTNIITLCNRDKEDYGIEND
jgi:hypothetical protein